MTGSWRRPLLRVGASGICVVATLAPTAANAACLALGPGPVRGVVVVPETSAGQPFRDGSVRVSWKPPVVQTGKTAKATSYSVRCGSAHGTTKHLYIRLDSVTDAQRPVTCALTTFAGKVAGRVVKTAPIITYHAYGASVLQYDTALAAIMSKQIDADSPAISASHGFAMPVVTNLEHFPNVLRHAGSLHVGLLRLVDVRLLEDSASTTDEPIEDLVGYDTLSHRRITLFKARTYDIAKQTFVAHAPVDKVSLAWLTMAGLHFTRDQVIGTYRAVVLG